jgi:hypothetical protein
MNRHDTAEPSRLSSSLVRRYPLLSFFVLAYAITWAIWAPILARARGWVTWEADGVTTAVMGLGRVDTVLVLQELRVMARKLKNVTVTRDEETARWARIQVAEQETSVSRLLSDLLRREMESRTAYDRRSMRPV